MTATTVDQERKTTGTKVPTPLPFWQSLLMFALPAILLRLCLYNGAGWIISKGISQANAIIAAFLIPSLLVFVLPFIALRLDGYILSWAVIKNRFRLQRMTGSAWIWAIGSFLPMFVIVQLLGFTGRALVKIPQLTPPDHLAFLNPNIPISLSHFLGVSVYGNWGFWLAFTLLVLFQVIAEELWWRGYIFPRQELTYKGNTWIVHGLLWTGFHTVFYPWNPVVYLVFCMTVAFVAQRTKSTWASFIVHILYNSLTPVVLLLAVLGVAK